MVLAWRSAPFTSRSVCFRPIPAIGGVTTFIRDIAEIRTARHSGWVSKLIAFLAFVVWEAWWGYVYFTTPRPDEKMNAIAALFMGVAVPIWLALVGIIIVWIRRSAKRN